MSKKGAHIPGKNGGAHGNPHGKSPWAKTISILSKSRENSGLNYPKSNILTGDCLNKNQNGVDNDDDNVQSIISTETSSSKNKNENFINHPNVEISVADLNTANFLSFDVHNVVTTNNGADLHDDNCQTGKAECTEEKITQCMTIEDLFHSNADISVVNLTDSFPVSTESFTGSPVKSLLLESPSAKNLDLCNYNVESNAAIQGLTVQDQACLEELEHSSNLSQEERDMLEASCKDLNSFAFVNLDLDENDRNAMLMSPHELESLPNGGLEFEESVGLTPSDGKTQEMVHAAVASEDLMNYTTTTIESVNSASKMTNTHNIAAKPVAAGSKSKQVKNPSGPSTITVSNNSTTKIAQIVIQTPQGQQVIQIDTTELAQATSQPIFFTREEPSGEIRQNTALNSSVAATNQKDGLLLIPLNTNQKTSEQLQPSSSVAQINNRVKDTNQNVVLRVVNEAALVGDDLVLDPTTMEPVSSMPMIPEKSEDGNRIYVCSFPDCRRTFQKPSKLKIHLMQHTGERPYKCSVDGCDWAFTTGYRLRRHEESHKKFKCFKCDKLDCGKTFSTVYNLNTHKRLHDRENNECPAPGCGKMFSSKHKLEMHLREHPGYERLYKCPHEGCTRVFNSLNCISSHARVHQNNPQPLTCEQCGKSFERYCRLKQHMRMHTGEKPYHCTYEGCGWSFPTASKLTRHQRKHTGERKYVCTICNKGFMRSEHLKGHLITHNGNRPFVCPVEGCNCKFTARSSLYVHMKKHDQSGEKIIYHCPLEGCLKKYNAKASLRNHINRHLTLQTSLSGSGDINIWPSLLADEESMATESLHVSSIKDGASVQTLQQCYTSNAVLTPANINPAEYIQSAIPTDNILVTTSLPQQQQQQQHQQNLITQPLFVSGDIGHYTVSTAATGDPSAGGTSGVTTLLVTSPQHQQQQPQYVKIDPPPSVMQQEVDQLIAQPLRDEDGSARTDFHSNKLMSDLAKKRRQMMKENGSTLGVISLQEAIQKSREHQLQMLSDNSPIPSSMASSLYSPTDLMASQAITFRDPETGVTYVTTQLLQDDPPNPTMPVYEDDNELSPGVDHDFKAVLLHSDDSHHGNIEFPNTTINLQDLGFT